MALTVASAITRMRRKFTDISSATALEYLNLVHREILHLIPLSVVTEAISLTAGTYSYAINENDARVWAADYFLESGGDPYRLQGTSYEELNKTQTLWRTLQSQPTRYAIFRNADDLVLLLNPVPDTTTSGGYPIVNMYVTRITDLTDVGDLPVALRNTDVYVFGALYRWAIDMYDQKLVPMLKNLYDEAIRKEIDAHQVFNVQAPPKTIPYFRGPSVTW